MHKKHKKTCTIVCSEILFSENSYHVKTNKLIAFLINWPISIWYEFLLKAVSKQTLIIATVINWKVILVLYNLNSTKGTKSLTSWNIKIVLQNLRYKHKQNIKIPKCELAYKDFNHEMFLFSHQSKNIYRQSVLLPKFRH